MKTFNFAEFHKNGNKFFQVSYKFDSVNGLYIEAVEKEVSIKRGIGACSGCDFISGGASCSSDNFFEQSLNSIKINGLYFKQDYHYKLSGFIYCLPENLTICKANLKQTIKAFIRREAFIMEKSAIALNEHI